MQLTSLGMPNVGAGWFFGWLGVIQSLRPRTNFTQVFVCKRKESGTKIQPKDVMVFKEGNKHHFLVKEIMKWWLRWVGRYFEEFLQEREDLGLFSKLDSSGRGSEQKPV